MRCRWRGGVQCGVRGSGGGNEMVEVGDGGGDEDSRGGLEMKLEVYEEVQMMKKGGGVRWW